MLSFKSFINEQHSEMKPQDGYDSASKHTHHRKHEIKKHVDSHKPITNIKTEGHTDTECTPKKDIDKFHRKLDKLVHKSIGKSSVEMKEDGGAAAIAAGPTNTVGSVAGSGDSRLPASQREPGVSRKKKGHNPVMMGFRRKAPKI